MNTENVLNTRLVNLMDQQIRPFTQATKRQPCKAIIINRCRDSKTFLTQQSKSLKGDESLLACNHDIFSITMLY